MDERPEMAEDLIRADYYKLLDVFGDEGMATTLLSFKYKSYSVVQIGNIVSPKVVPNVEEIFATAFNY